MGVRENAVEKQLTKQVTEIGGMCRKWVSGCAGTPDRIVVFKGYVCAVEVKTVNGAISPQQHREIAKLSKAGMDSHVVFGNTGVKNFVSWLNGYVQGEPASLSITFK